MTDDRPSELTQQILELEAKRDRIQTEIAESQDYFARFMQDSLKDLDRRRQELQRSVDQLERRQTRIQEEMKGTFAGSSQDIAIRVQSFKDYLTGSLEDLVLAAQKLNIGQLEPEIVPAASAMVAPVDDTLEEPQFARSVYEQQTEKIRAVVRIFRTEPDYYGPVWKLRRTFESIHADRINDWFFTQGGRATLNPMTSMIHDRLG